MSKFAAKNNLSYAVENYGIQIKLRAVCFRAKYKNKTKAKFRPLLDRTEYCLLKTSDNSNFVEIKKFKDCVSVSNNLCLKYVCKQCVSTEDIFSTVHIRYDYLRGFHEAKQERKLKQQCCTYIQLLNILLGRKYCIKLKDHCSRLEARLRRACSEIKIQRENWSILASAGYIKDYGKVCGYPITRTYDSQKLISCSPKRISAESQH